MDQSLVSIIVPCYNQAHYLEESLQSVLNQTFTNWECIIVNDGSPDKTEEIANNWIKRDKRFHYVFKKNGGLSSARNYGINKSHGIYILPLDADDVIDASFLSKLVPELETNESLGIVSCYSKFFFKNLKNIVNELKPTGSTSINLLYVNQLIATSLYRKKCWEEVGGYDENMKTGFEDWEFWIAITKRGWNYKIIPDFLFYYRKSKKSMLVDTINNHFETSKHYIIKKHRELYIEDFDNCMIVMFYHLKTYRSSEVKIKNSLEYKIGKLITKPFKIFQNIVSKS
ncbi:glycosyltransferase family 2 protein [Tamlana sp. s12]|uniref:glycosyltransferase family 2 protein n=1 Tax=Tamlana sp. s12 TaxID=1630406 RepID=UPI000800D22B|nr:glycosyltransferase family A protein [Tamlana sp. s12]OBQ55400.1 glycosyl transferase family 2 [Tamlana sp. s12]QQY80920.1 glycosyltransferase family 2 protein [Tamlana sp. s12]